MSCHAAPVISVLNHYVVACACYFVSLCPTIGGLLAATKIHKVILDGIIRCPISFFDTTPTGRILSRFSSDVATCDSTLPEIMVGFMYLIFQVKSILKISALYKCFFGLWCLIAAFRNFH